jgi:hypothetical protein
LVSENSLLLKTWPDVSLSFTDSPSSQLALKFYSDSWNLATDPEVKSLGVLAPTGGDSLRMSPKCKEAEKIRKEEGEKQKYE